MFGIFSKSKKSSSKKKKKKGSAKARKKPVEAPLDATAATQSDIIIEEEQAPPSPAASIASAQEKLDQAKANLDSGNFKKGLAPGDRQALIQQALAVHKVQSKLLDDLGEDTKERLRSIAMEKVFKIPPKN